jgi:hypothetical protein
MKLIDILNEYTVNKPTLISRLPKQIQVIKNIYRLGDKDWPRPDTMYVQDEVDNFFVKMLYEGDIWEKITSLEDEDEGDDVVYRCISGQMEGEDNKGAWEQDPDAWEYNDSTKDFFKVLKR